jgi:hypothetical protein
VRVFEAYHASCVFFLLTVATLNRVAPLQGAGHPDGGPSGWEHLEKHAKATPALSAHSAPKAAAPEQPEAQAKRLDFFATAPTAGAQPYLDVVAAEDSDGEVDLDADIEPARCLFPPLRNQPLSVPSNERECCAREECCFGIHACRLLDGWPMAFPLGCVSLLTIIPPTQLVALVQAQYENTTEGGEVDVAAIAAGAAGQGQGLGNKPMGDRHATTWVAPIKPNLRAGYFPRVFVVASIWFAVCKPRSSMPPHRCLAPALTRTRTLTLTPTPTLTLQAHRQLEPSGNPP